MGNRNLPKTYNIEHFFSSLSTLHDFGLSVPVSLFVYQRNLSRLREKTRFFCHTKKRVLKTRFLIYSCLGLDIRKSGIPAFIYDYSTVVIELGKDIILFLAREVFQRGIFHRLVEVI